MHAILKRWRANGGSAYDPIPTFAHHAYHMLTASLLSILLTDRLGVDWLVVGASLSVLSLFLELAQYLGWIGKPANRNDCLFDFYQYQIHWIWYGNIWFGLAAFILYSWGYLKLLVKLVDEEGNPT